MNKNTIHKASHIVYIVLYGSLILSSILVYNVANLEILLYFGWTILVFGIIFLLLASRSRKIGRAQEGKGINKENLIESGMYAFVRHPEFLGHILIIFALIFIAQYWLSLVIGVMLIVLLCLAMMEEEKRNIEKFGDGYKDYIQRVPRINLLVGIIKQMHYTKENEKDR